MIDGLAGARVDDVRVEAIADLHAAAVIAAGGDGAVADQQVGDGGGVLGVVDGVGEVDRLGPGAADTRSPPMLTTTAVTPGTARAASAAWPTM